MEENKCEICKEMFDDSDTYEYRGFLSCGEHFDELQVRVDDKRELVMETINKSSESQRNGEWDNGGYKTMKTDSGGRPITKIKEPLVENEYKEGKL